MVLFKQYNDKYKGEVDYTVPVKNETDNDVQIFDADKWSVFSDRTAEDIAERYADLAVYVDENDLYESVPETGGSYSIGVLSDNVKNSIISNINYYRWLEGVPEISLWEENCVNDQAVAFYEVLKTQDKNVRENQTDSIPEEIYRLCIEAVSDSIVKPTAVSTAVRDSLCGEMDFDEDGILTSRMTVLSHKNSKVSAGYYSGVFACSSSEGDGMVYAFASYPSPGLFPANDIDKELSAWHIELNSEMIVYGEIEDINVEITDMTDGTVYNRKPGDGLYVKDDLIVFYPPKENGTMFKHKYQIIVYGLKTLSGTDAAIKYTVDFFDRTEYEKTEVINIKSECGIIYAPADMADSQLKEFFPQKAEAELGNGRTLDIKILDWKQSVSEGGGFDENKYIAIIDNDINSRLIIDTENLLRNIGIRVIRYQDGVGIDEKTGADGKTELSVISDTKKTFKDISWYYEDENGEIQFIEASERLYIDNVEEREVYFAVGKEGQESDILYVMSTGD